MMRRHAVQQRATRGWYSASMPALAPLVAKSQATPTSVLGAKEPLFPERRRNKHKLKFAEYIPNEKLLAPKIEPLIGDHRTGWTQQSKRCGLICVKLGMTHDYNEYMDYMPVTVLQVMDNLVVQVKDDEKEEKDGYIGLQVGATLTLPKRVKKPQRHHFMEKGLQPMKKLMEFRVTEDAILPPGTELRAEHFVPGQLLDLQAKSKGKGFQGVMKRYGFSGGRASHGAKNHRQMGSTGQCQDPGRVWKGKKMPGRMGGKTTTVKNLLLWKIDTQHNLLFIKGHVPGPSKGYVRVIDAKNKRHEIPPPFPTWKEEWGPLPPQVCAESSKPDWFSKLEGRMRDNGMNPEESTTYTADGPDDKEAVERVLKWRALQPTLYKVLPNFYTKPDPVPVDLFDQEADDEITREFLRQHWENRDTKLPEEQAAALAAQIEETLLRTKKQAGQIKKEDWLKKNPLIPRPKGIFPDDPSAIEEEGITFTDS